MTNTSDNGGWFIWGLLLSSILWTIWTLHYTQTNTDIIKHKAAYYHPETGEFTWRTEENPHEDGQPQ